MCGLVPTPPGPDPAWSRPRRDQPLPTDAAPPKAVTVPSAPASQ
jgi:hypothetical protein